MTTVSRPRPSLITAISDEPKAPDLVRRLGLLEREVTALRADVAALRQALPSTVTPISDAEFLIAVASAVQGHCFSARELVNHATVDPVLKATLHGVTSPRRVGKRLHRLADQDVGGLRLVRIDRDRDGVVWIVQVADLHTNA